MDGTATTSVPAALPAVTPGLTWIKPFQILDWDAEFTCGYVLIKGTRINYMNSGGHIIWNCRKASLRDVIESCN